MQHKLMNVEALWPKIDRPYKWSTEQNRSVPTEATDPEGKYELNLVITDDQAKELAKVMKDEFKNKKEKGWKEWAPKGLDDIFKKDDGVWQVKTVKKTYSDPSSKPSQYMLDGTKCPDDFQLTTGSKIHVMLLVKPWNYAGNSGVTLRPAAIKVVELRERLDGGDPFADQSVKAEVSDDPFAPNANDFDDEIPF